MILTQTEYPSIVKAFHLLDSDGGLERSPPLPLYSVPDKYVLILPVMESALRELREDRSAPEADALPPHVKPDMKYDCELAQFVLGEYSVRERIAQRNEGLKLAVVFLGEYWKDFVE